MVILTERGKIEISDSVLAELIGLSVRDSVGVFEMAPKNLTENLVEFLGFDGRDRGVSVRQESQGLIVELNLQFWQGLSIAECSNRLIFDIQRLVEDKLGVVVAEVRIVVAGVSDRSYGDRNRDRAGNE